MQRLRLRIIATQVYYCFYINGESTDNAISTITLGGDLGQE